MRFAEAEIRWWLGESEVRDGGSLHDPWGSVSRLDEPLAREQHLMAVRAEVGQGWSGWVGDESNTRTDLRPLHVVPAGIDPGVRSESVGLARTSVWCVCGAVTVDRHVSRESSGLGVLSREVVCGGDALWMILSE